MSSHRMSRRDFVAAGCRLAGVSAIGLAYGCSPDAIVSPRVLRGRLESRTPVGADLGEPLVLRSEGGVLSARLTAGTAPAELAGRRALQPVVFNGRFPGPTLWVRPGDVVELDFTNRIVFDQGGTRPGYGRPPRAANETNVHFHGMHISPVGTADNMTVMVPPNGSFRYRFQIPADHPAGLYWYHAHVHGLVTNHVSRGMAGMIYVANAYTDAVEGLGIRHRLLALQQAYLEPDLRTLTFEDVERLNPERGLSLINGVLNPTLRLRPGEPQVWSLLNASSSAFYVLRLEGHTFDVIADDGVPLLAPGRPDRSTLMLPSGKRLEVVVRASTKPGRYSLAYDAYDQGVDVWPAKTIGTVVVEGETWSGPDHPGVDATVPVVDLTAGEPAATRRIVFGESEEFPEGEFGRFTINGRAYDPDYVEWTSRLDTLEEWLIENETEQDHPFHVHTNPFQVTHVNGARVPFDGYEDTAIIPRFGSLTVRTRFTDFTGGPVLMHCHILDHEDMGMMTSIYIA